MQVTSLLTTKHEAPSTRWFRWTRRVKHPDIIDVKCITPNPFIKWIKNHWKRTAATAIIRISRCWKASDPGAWTALVAGVVLGVTTMVFPIMLMEHFPTFFTFILRCIWRCSWLTLSFELIIYGLWEMIQGFKWLKEWAKNHTEHGYIDDD